MASAQLQLITNQPKWKLDRRTVEVGRAGIAQARAALAAATLAAAPTDGDDAAQYGGLFAYHTQEHKAQEHRAQEQQAA